MRNLVELQLQAVHYEMEVEMPSILACLIPGMSRKAAGAKQFELREACTVILDY